MRKKAIKWWDTQKPATKLRLIQSILNREGLKVTGREVQIIYTSLSNQFQIISFPDSQEYQTPENKGLIHPVITEELCEIHGNGAFFVPLNLIK